MSSESFCRQWAREQFAVLHEAVRVRQRGRRGHRVTRAASSGAAAHKGCFTEMLRKLQHGILIIYDILYTITKNII